MTMLMHLADSTLQYIRGKQTGFWGIIGIFLAICIVIMWSDIKPVFVTIGITPLLDQLGIIHPDDPGVTGFKIFLLLIGVQVVLFIFGFIAITIFAMVGGIFDTKVGDYLQIGCAILVFLPILIPIAFLYGLAQIPLYLHDRKLKRQDPDGYAERKRLEKNKNVIDQLISDGCSEEESNILSYEDGYEELDRLPSRKEFNFLYGIGYDREIYLLLPRPLSVKEWYYDNILCEKLDVVIYNPNIHKPMTGGYYEPKKFRISINNENREEKFGEYLGHDIPIIPINKIEFFIDPSKSSDLFNFSQYYAKSLCYIEYVKSFQSHFFTLKNNIIRKLTTVENTDEEYSNLYNELVTLHACNEEDVRKEYEEDITEKG
ncbi:hypothetical protein [Bacillus alkalicellulosilyticus]|uniref:hypothetical protein n=1 Tax=Alkalihalobacterium alkalicellulosilyticum TaxID=1912214 RepID=UPI000998D8CE|nr:hypothetical protein [Bacillus alkalicellulosilyticus]